MRKNEHSISLPPQNEPIIFKSDEEMNQHEVELIHMTMGRICVLTTRYKSKSERDQIFKFKMIKELTPKNIILKRKNGQIGPHQNVGLLLCNRLHKENEKISYRKYLQTTQPMKDLYLEYIGTLKTEQLKKIQLAETNTTL